MGIEKALEENKTLQKLTLSDYYRDNDVTPPKEFCRHLMIGIGLNTSLSEVDLKFVPSTGTVQLMVGWCMSVTCCVTQLDVVYSV